MAGLRYDLSPHSGGLQLSVAGYNDKILLLLRTLMEKINAFKAEASRFSVLHQHLDLKLRNLLLEAPFLTTEHRLNICLRPESGPETSSSRHFQVVLTSLSQWYPLSSPRYHTAWFGEAFPRYNVAHFPRGAYTRQFFLERFVSVCLSVNLFDNPKQGADAIVGDIELIMVSNELPLFEQPVERFLVLTKGAFPERIFK